MDTIKELINFIGQHPTNAKALNVKNNQGEWQSLSTSDTVNQILWIAAGLQALGIKAGDKVAIMSPPTSEWTICDLAIMLMGAISVPIFHLISKDHFLYQVRQCEVKTIFVCGKESHEICQNYAELFQHIIAIEETIQFKGWLLYNDILTKGQSNGQCSFVENQPTDLATIIYTSGSVGLPKGVELTHKNLVHELIPSQERMKWNSQDIFVHYLPMAHIFGRLMNFNLLMANASIYYVKDAKQIFETCREIKPTVFVLIPRMIEKMYTSIVNQIKGKKNLQKALASWAYNLAHKERYNLWDRLCTPLADLFLYSKIRDFLGGALRIVLSGSAKSNPQLLNFFIHAGFPIIEGYGMTEACPAISNSPEEMRIGYLGRPMPEVEVALSEEGEILLRGPIVMRGYYKNPELTRETIDTEGWLHTSDLGTIDAEGFIQFKGRKSDICKCSHGEFVNLPLIEEQLNQLFFVDTSLAIVEDRPYVSCLLFVDRDLLAALKKRLGLAHLSDEELLQTDYMQKEWSRALAQINARLNHWERIRAYRFILHKASIEGGEFSPAMKLRRPYIHTKYQDLIEEMYPAKALKMAV